MVIDPLEAAITAYVVMPAVEARTIVTFARLWADADGFPHDSSRRADAEIERDRVAWRWFMAAAAEGRAENVPTGGSGFRSAILKTVATVGAAELVNELRLEHSLAMLTPKGQL